MASLNLFFLLQFLSYFHPNFQYLYDCTSGNCFIHAKLLQLQKMMLTKVVTEKLILSLTDFHSVFPAACGCNVNGTDPATCANGLCDCDLISGQCSCKLATIAGRTCDQCGRLDQGEMINFVKEKNH